MHSSTTKRLSIAILVVFLISIAIMEGSANPAPDHADPANVVDALRYLQDLESKHAQFARPRNYEHIDGVSVVTYILEMLEQLDRKHARTPRFGKRANTDYLTKEYTQNVLRFILENPELFQHPQQES